MACNEKNPLQRDGSSQSQRFLNALDPANAPIDELGMEEWLTFAAAYAKDINYFGLTDSDHPQGDWAQFFIEDKDAITAFLAQAQLKIKNAQLDFPDSSIQSDIEPHLALFMCFILLLQHSKDALNLFTGRHLDFYYKQVLQLRNRPEVPDKVHVIFELARNLQLFGLPAGTTLDAGKDNSTKPLPLVYQTNSELAVNSATIAAMKSFYQSAADKKIYYADVTFSADGLGTPFKDPIPKWNPFGNKDTNGKIVWPTAAIGFAFASKVLLLSEGTRTVTLTLSFNASPGNLVPDDLASAFKVFLTSDKDWLQADFAATTPIQITSSGGIYQLIVTVSLPVKAGAVVPYNQTIHKENYQTDNPVVRLLMNVQDDKSFAIYQALSKAVVTKVQIDVDVTGMKNLAVENDNGKLDPSKPFLAFGPQPKVGSNLYIGSAEIFQKNWSEIIPNIKWKSVPDDLKKYYYCYRKNYLLPNFSQTAYHLASTSTDIVDVNPPPSLDDNTDGGLIIAGADSFTAAATYLRDGAWYPTSAADSEIKIFTTPFTLKPDGVSQAVSGYSYFINQYVYFSSDKYSYNTQAQKAVVQQYVTPMQVSTPFLGFSGFSGITSNVQTQTANFSAGVKDNYIRISLNQDFLHDLYPQIFAVAMSKGKSFLIPKAPYTPEIAALTVDYKASETNDVSTLTGATSPNLLNDYISRDVQFFHETPFGQSEQHVFLKNQYSGLIDTTITLLPKVPDVSGFYIGIANIPTGSIASILFQVAEGSEDAMAPSFTDTLFPVWYFLSGNEWLPVSKNNIISNDTNNLLRSGIIKFLIPDAATTNNTFLNQGLTWLAVELPAGFSVDSVCKFINVHIQAAQAQFADNNNELSHLQNGLPPATISKLVNRLPQIKSVTQPYASFGGSLPENDKAFTLRVSERLRHKHRAIDIWDYEHLVMGQFPQVYRVKCLNHTNDDYEVAPGSVRVVVIPDIRNQNSFDPFQPRVSKNILSEITKYLAGLNSMHVDLNTINPDYEEIKLDFKVKFYAGYDENLYAIQLNTDLINYLSPWAFNRNAEIDFGGTLYKSVVIRFIEELSYVDYIADFKMYFTKTGVADPDILAPENSKAILVSAKQHLIDTKNIPVC